MTHAVPALPLAGHDTSGALLSIGLLLLLFILGQLGQLRRLMPRLWFRTWHYDGELTREYRRETYRDRDGPLIDASTRDQRRVAAAVLRRRRMVEFAKVGAMLTAGGIGCFYFYHHPRPLFWATNEFWMMGEFATLAAAFCAFILVCQGALRSLKPLWFEALYLAGVQGWDGARVLDPPARPEPPPEHRMRPYAPTTGGGPATAQAVNEAFSGNRAAAPKPRFRD